MAIVNHKLIEAQFVETPNVGGELRNPQFIVVHYTAGRSAAKSAQWLCNKKAKASAHLIIGRRAELYQLAPFNKVTWHAGPSKFEGLTGLNSRSIGIELDNFGLLSKVGGKWKALHLGEIVPDSDVLEAQHKFGGPVRGWQLYSPAQIDLLEGVCAELIAAYPSIKDIVGHDDVAVPQGRKTDPGPALELDVLRSRLFGRG